MTADDDRAALAAASEEAIRRFAAERDPFLIDHTVQVTSFGGAGTTALCDHLLDAGVDLQRGPAQWPFKHRRQPPTAGEVPAGFRVVYLLADPRDAVVSVFRRGIQVGHYCGLHEEEPPPEVRARLASLDAFVAGGIDDFALADHVDRWERHPPGYPVLFVRYDHLGEVWSELAAFVGLDAGVPPLPVRRRESDWRSLPDAQREGIDAMYGDLAARIDASPPARVV